MGPAKIQFKNCEKNISGWGFVWLKTCIENVKARFLFAQDHVHWTTEQWARIVFSDELN